MGEVIRPDLAVLDRAVGAGQLPASVRAGLADPLARVSVLTVTRDGCRRLDCYVVDGESKRLAGITPNENGAAAVSFPIDPKAVEALLAETLGLDQPLADFGHRSEFDIAALWALAAMIDAHRQRQLEALLARSPAPALAIDDDSIHLRALDGATLADPRWLSSLLHGLLGPADVSEARLRDGLAVLARGGLIARDAQGTWAPQPSFAAAFANLEVPLAGTRLAIDRRRDGGVDHIALVFLRTLAAVWIIQPRGAGNSVQRALLRSAGGEEARTFARSAIELAVAPPPKPQPKPQPAAPKPSTSTTTTAAARFCHQCGKPAAAGDRFCGECGTQLV